MKFIALLLALAVASAPAASAAESTAEVFAAQFPLTRVVLAADFPQDLVALEQSLSDKIEGTDSSTLQKMQRVSLKLTALRQKYAPRMRFARSATSAVVVLSLANFYQSVLQRDGSAVCGSFAAEGAAALYAKGTALAYARDLDRQGATYFTAAASALENPDVVGFASQDDWNLVMKQIVADGHPVSYIASIAAARTNDPDICPALSAFMHAMVEVKPDTAQRMRADFIQTVTHY